MQYINEFLKPGTYQDKEQKVVVVVDVITHQYNLAGSPTPYACPMVVFRNLIQDQEMVDGKPRVIHKRFSLELNLFNQTFKPC